MQKCPRLCRERGPGCATIFGPRRSTVLLSKAAGSHATVARARRLGGYGAALPGLHVNDVWPPPHPAPYRHTADPGIHRARVHGAGPVAPERRAHESGGSLRGWSANDQRSVDDHLLTTGKHSRAAFAGDVLRPAMADCCRGETMQALVVFLLLVSGVGYPLAPGSGYRTHHPPRQRFVALAVSSCAAAAEVRGVGSST